MGLFNRKGRRKRAASPVGDPPSPARVADPVNAPAAVKPKNKRRKPKVVTPVTPPPEPATNPVVTPPTNPVAVAAVEPKHKRKRGVSRNIATLGKSPNVGLRSSKARGITEGKKFVYMFFKPSIQFNKVYINLSVKR